MPVYRHAELPSNPWQLPRFVKPAYALTRITLTYAPERISITGETA